jgi:zinc protease
VTASFIARFGDEKSLFGKVAVAQLTGATDARHPDQVAATDPGRNGSPEGANQRGGGVNNAVVSIQTTEANLAGALKLAAEILREPAFPEAEFEQVRKQSVAGIEEGKSDPQALAGQALSAHVEQHVPARRCPLRRHLRRGYRGPE